MSIGSDLEVENAEHEARDEDVDSITIESAKLIALKKVPRELAIKQAIEIKHREQEALSNREYDEDEEGVISFWDSSLNGSTIPKDKEAQVKAIASELRAKVDQQF
ncbi:MULTISPECIES: hypothetical protein [Shewanella]|uniref:hypothetical protein n=1 Tax=Shewanella TaxID=22 RepID=UPI00217B1968|nr:hypothetical protein [Shewanella xiamenensis]MCT8869289.1 hypothetical protein [Shewanella xiamenensis]MCT8873868.1 hypothetical protein [Shewanella xiamenensis]MCT8877534.1 hypothetical protein [Shewanella xiamenensis]UWH39969.1 hypothetical protein KXJ80_00255 [Shewanella xiamenensis]BDQ68458.1 hypothetical protein NUITMVS2_42710 [Shewanella xiamenensis]